MRSHLAFTVEADWLEKMRVRDGFSVVRYVIGLFVVPIHVYVGYSRCIVS